MSDSRIPRPRPFPGDRPAPRERKGTPELNLAVVEYIESLGPPVRGGPGTAYGDLMCQLGARNLATAVRAEYDRQQEAT